MIAIPDLELTVRIGALDSNTAEAVRRVALEAADRLGLDDEDVLYVARGLHWLAVGYQADASAEHMVAALFLTPALPETSALIAAALDEIYGATAAQRGAAHPPDPLGLTDRGLLGWRLTVALALVQGEELLSAWDREQESAP
jgi:hypothetical protein